MEFLITVRTLIATTVMLFCSLWLARQLKIHRPRLPGFCRFDFVFDYAV